jgi:methylamine dehydrogenase accessory protein MauD
MTGWWTASYVVLWLLVIVLTVLLLSLARQVGTLHLRLGPRGALELDDEGPPLGEAPGYVQTRDRDGNPVTIGGPGPPQFLLFVSPDCPICREVAPSLSAASRGGRFSPYLISDSSESTNGNEYPWAARSTPVIHGPEIAEAYGIPGTPYAVVLDRLGVVRAKGTVNNLEQMEGLVDTALARLRRMPAGARTG